MAYDNILAQLMMGMPMLGAPQPPKAPNENFRANVPTPYGRGVQDMRQQNGILSAAQTQMENQIRQQYPNISQRELDELIGQQFGR